MLLNMKPSSGSQDEGWPREVLAGSLRGAQPAPPLPLHPAPLRVHPPDGGAAHPPQDPGLPHLPEHPGEPADPVPHRGRVGELEGLGGCS